MKKIILLSLFIALPLMTEQPKLTWSQQFINAAAVFKKSFIRPFIGLHSAFHKLNLFQKVSFSRFVPTLLAYDQKTVDYADHMRWQNLQNTKHAISKGDVFLFNQATDRYHIHEDLIDLKKVSDELFDASRKCRDMTGFEKMRKKSHCEAIEQMRIKLVEDEEMAVHYDGNEKAFNALLDQGLRTKPSHRLKDPFIKTLNGDADDCTTYFTYIQAAGGNVIIDAENEIFKGKEKKDIHPSFEMGRCERILRFQKRAQKSLNDPEYTENKNRLNYFSEDSQK